MLVTMLRKAGTKSFSQLVGASPVVWLQMLHPIELPLNSQPIRM